jgi:hypothetical protein
MSRVTHRQSIRSPARVQDRIDKVHTCAIAAHAAGGMPPLCNVHLAHSVQPARMRVYSEWIKASHERAKPLDAVLLIVIRRTDNR